MKIDWKADILITRIELWRIYTIFFITFDCWDYIKISKSEVGHTHVKETCAHHIHTYVYFFFDNALVLLFLHTVLFNVRCQITTKYGPLRQNAAQSSISCKTITTMVAEVTSRSEENERLLAARLVKCYPVMSSYKYIFYLL